MTRPRIAILLGLAIVMVWSMPLLAQGQSEISEPTAEEPISGIVVISGTAVDPNFMRYELAFRNTANPDWIVFAQGDQPVIDGTLAVWDTTVGRETVPVFPDGTYLLRLRVVRTDFNYDEYFAANITIANDEPTPTPTATISDISPTLSAEDSSSGTSQPAAGPLPSLTPFPTPPPRATPVNSISSTGDQSYESDEQESGGVFDQLSSVDTSGLGRAFWRGVTLVALAFGALAIYLLFRGAFRRIWRRLQTKLFR
ncbi:MAG TPA: hypothetical protein VFI27_10550 [candidate division Zixibacteria bacterium]|nr:hypothetical protein [candidate division Zixibacteria bacterium]